MQISAYVPVFNNRTTLEPVLRAIQQQSHAIDDLFVIDDGSADGSDTLAERMDVRVIRQPSNAGRGAARARAMNAARHELVLCCDATNVLDPNFVRDGLHWFEDPRTGAVFGRITQASARTAAERWRGRHLFKMNDAFEVRRHSPLITFGTLMRKSAALEAGNYDPARRHNEDVDLGERLLAAKYDIIFDPSLLLFSIARNTVGQVLERYSRWYGPRPDELSWSGYLRQMAYSLKSMARLDLSERDLLSVPISLLCPHVQYARSLFEFFRIRRQTR